mgnify:CR=1 FL=1
MLCCKFTVCCCLLLISARVFLVCVVWGLCHVARNEEESEEYKLFDHYTWGMSPVQGGSLSVAWQWVAWPAAAAAPVAAPCCCQHIVTILACDWSALITWPEYWAPIGRGVVNILSLLGRRGRGPLGTLYSACLDKHANKHINIQLGIFHAPWAEHTAVIRSPEPQPVPGPREESSSNWKLFVGEMLH